MQHQFIAPGMLSSIHSGHQPPALLGQDDATVTGIKMEAAVDYRTAWAESTRPQECAQERLLFGERHRLELIMLLWNNLFNHASPSIHRAKA